MSRMETLRICSLLVILLATLSVCSCSGSGTGEAPPSVSALVLNPSNVTAGTSSTGTITLTGPAPGGGIIVTLRNSNTNAATGPASQAVAAGNTTATFTVTTVSVPNIITSTIRAEIGSGPTATALMTVNPQVVGSTVQLTVNKANVHQTWLAWRATARGPSFPTETGLVTGGSIPPTVLANILNDVVDLGMTGYRVGLQLDGLGGGPNYDFSPSNPHMANFEPLLKQVVLPTKALVTAKGDPFSTYIGMGGSISTNPANNGWPWINNPGEYGHMATVFLKNYGPGG